MTSHFVPRRPAARGTPGVTSGLRRRLLVMLIVPLLLLAVLNAWLDYRSADDVALRQDQGLLATAPLLADSVLAQGPPPILLLAPAVEDFLQQRRAAFAVCDAQGQWLAGESWLCELPAADSPLDTQEKLGVTWRILRQRHATPTGDLQVLLADGSDPRQQWARSILLTVLLPNLVLVTLAAFAIRWAVERALKPLLDLRAAVEARSERDLSAIDESASPEEVRPLVRSLNRLFALVNAQAEGQRRFVADAAHQLRTPLAGLQAQVEAWAHAAAGQPAAEVRLPAEQVEKLRAATRRTSQLANQLLALSRADARSMQAQPLQPVALKPLCEDILEQHLDAASVKGIDLGLEAQPAQVPGHDWLLRELVANLVDNAVRYTPAGGTVTLRCEPLLHGALLEVEDDGPGIPATERAKVLERFHRVRGTGGEGNGLGLAIADEIARVHRTQLVLDEGAGGRGLKVSLHLLG